MKTFFAVLLALAAATSAAPTELEARQACKPATYACAWNPKANLAGWQVCDTSGHWVVSSTPSPFSQNGRRC
jgi:hypothetical protein